MVFYKINNHRVTKEFYAIVKSQCYKKTLKQFMQNVVSSVMYSVTFS